MSSFFLSLFSALLFWGVSCSRLTENGESAERLPPSRPLDPPELALRHSPSLPVGVKVAAGSVYRLLVHWDTAFAYEKLSHAQSAVYLEEHCGGGPRDFIEARNCDAIRRCFSAIEAEGVGFCHEPYLTGGTAWVVKSSEGRSVIVTNWHVFQRQFAPQMFLAPAIVPRPAAERKELLKQLEPIFSLYDASGNLVYESTQHATAPRIVGMGDVVGAAFSDPSVQAVATLVEDYVAVEIPLALGRPLAVAAEAPSMKEPAFALGYPVSTLGRKQNSDGQQLYFSSGHFYSPEQFLQLVEPLAKAVAHFSEPIPADQAPLVSKDYHLPTRGFVYSSCDVVGGNSGGPLLNSAGEVVGMVTRSYSNREKYEPAGSVALFVPHLFSE